MYDNQSHFHKREAITNAVRILVHQDVGRTSNLIKYAVCRLHLLQTVCWFHFISIDSLVSLPGFFFHFPFFYIAFIALLFSKKGIIQNSCHHIRFHFLSCIYRLLWSNCLDTACSPLTCVKLHIKTVRRVAWQALKCNGFTLVLNIEGLCVVHD